MPMSVSKGYDPGYFLRSTAAGKENYYVSAAESGLSRRGGGRAAAWPHLVSLLALLLTLTPCVPCSPSGCIR